MELQEEWGLEKSQVLSFMKERYGAVICQADQVAWKLQEPGCVCYEKIVAHFGTEILREDRTINRGILGEIVFGNAEEMAVLNGIVHPEVKAYIKEQIVTEKNDRNIMFCVGSGAFIGRSL